MPVRSTNCYLLPRFQWYSPCLPPLCFSFFTMLLYCFPHWCTIFDALALLFLKQITFLPNPKTLLFFVLEFSSPRPAWLSTSIICWTFPFIRWVSLKFLKWHWQWNSAPPLFFSKETLYISFLLSSLSHLVKFPRFSQKN